jgi:hypothetical protein
MVLLEVIVVLGILLAYLFDSKNCIADNDVEQRRILSFRRLKKEKLAYSDLASILGE